MTKAALLLLGLAAVMALPPALKAEDTYTATAVNAAVLRQANTIVLRQKLADARRAQQAGETAAAAKIYQESCELAQQIGSGIGAETAQAVNGLAATRLALARDAQAHGDLHEADNQARQVLKEDGNNAAALAFKKGNDQMMALRKGRMPSPEVLEQKPQVDAQKLDAKTLVQNGKLFYEMGKLEDAEGQLKQAMALDPDNQAAAYYMNLIQQVKFTRENAQHQVDSQIRMTDVEKHWILPANKNNLTAGNPYATNKLVYTGGGRQAIVAKLDHIRLDSVSFDGQPLSEVLRTLAEQSRLRDPERKGINFLINPNPDLSGPAIAGGGLSTFGVGAGGQGGGGGFGAAAPVAPAAPAAIDPATGLPAANAAPAAGGGEAADVGSYIVKIPNLADVRLAEVLDAIVLVSDHPIKYTVQDFAVVFSAKGAESPQLFTRIFKVDPNTFYSGLDSVSAMPFGSVSSSGGGGGGGSRGGGGGGGGGGSGNNQNNGAVVGIVNAFSGAGSFRSSGSSGGGGGGGGGGNQNGAVNPLAGNVGGGQGGGGGSVNGGGGMEYITKVTLAQTVSEAARAYFTALGVNLVSPPGKAVFFNDRLGKLFVKATEQDLDTIERAIEMLNEVPSMVHIKSRFIEVEQDDNKALGFDWYLGQFNMSSKGGIVGQGGTAPSLTVPVSSRNPDLGTGAGAFPGQTAANVIGGQATDQLLTGGLRNSGSTVATITGILTDPNFRMVIHALEQRSGSENLGEPEVTTTSGRQTQMRATQILNVVTDFTFDNGSASGANNNTANGSGNGNVVNQAGVAAVSPVTQQVETGPVLDVVPYILSDGYTVNLALIPSFTEFNGYDTISSSQIPGYNPGSTIGSLNGTTLPVALPKFTVRQVVTTVNVWDNQTVVLGGLISSTVQNTKDKLPVIGDLPFVGRLFQSQSKTTTKNNLMIFVTATIVDPAGNRVHTDDDLPFAQNSVPAQPAGAGQVKETVKQTHDLPVAQ